MPQSALGLLIFVIPSLEIIENKAKIRQVKDCWGCTACVKSCAVNAIGYYLGADIGGSGSLLYVKDKGEILEWIIDKVNEKKEKIIVCKSDSNQY